MMAFHEWLPRREETTTYLALSLLVVLIGAILSHEAGGYFRPYFGDTSAPLLLGVWSVLGAVGLLVLANTYGFRILDPATVRRGVVLSGIFASVLAVTVVAADVLFRYPEDLNVPLPDALLFYPAIGFVAEILFHVVPLALLLLLFKPLEGFLGEDRTVWIGLLLVAGMEPTFQVMAQGGGLTWINAYTGIHVYAVSVVQLYLFRHFDFVSMYTFRLIYYLYWHVLWGTLRLELLF